MNPYTKLIAEGLMVEPSEARKIQSFIECFYDGFIWNSASVLKILNTAEMAQRDMQDPALAGWEKWVTND